MSVGIFSCVAMLLNNKITSIFINVAQHEQYEQQQVYVIKMSPIYDCMSKQPQSSSEEVKIRLKHRDWEVEITCLENKVKQVGARMPRPYKKTWPRNYFRGKITTRRDSP